MKLINVCVLGLWTLFSSAVVMAEPIHVKLILDKIEQVKVTKAWGGDELYFGIAQFSSDRKQNRFYEVPEFPEAWVSKNLSHIQNLTLWDMTLKDEQAIQLVVALTERETPPWGVDDLVGLLKIQLKNSKEGLLQKWDFPAGYSAPQVKMEQTDKGRYFVLTGDNSEYKIALSIR